MHDMKKNLEDQFDRQPIQIEYYKHPENDLKPRAFKLTSDSLKLLQS